MKTITNTLLIAAIFTSNIVASQACMGTQCLATFAKPVDYKVTPSFKQVSISKKEQMHNNNTIEQPLFQENVVDKIDTNQYQLSNDEIVELEIANNAPLTEVYSEDFTSPAEYDLEETEMNPLVTNNNIEDVMIETVKEDIKLTINLETICKENQELVSCDTINESTECVCV